MTDTQKKAIRDKIGVELERLVRDIATLEDITRPVADDDMDEISRMDSIVNKSVNEAALAVARNRLAGLEYALKRIDDPEFGLCMDCGEEIPLARLLAMPESALCVECAS